nr:DNA polymerase III subunit alpha [Myxosarcina sp. GI1]
MTFVGLHIHSDYSLLDGASQIPQLIDRALELEMPAIALTDHGVMYGAIELIKVCRNKGIKPIIGNEMYVINGDIEINPKEKKKRHKKFHQVVLAKNTQGYRNLVKLTTISHLKGFQGSGIFARPCVNKELLEKYHEGLIVTSACLGGEVPQRLLANNYDEAKKVAKWYQDVFGDDYYLEIQDHGSPEDRIVNVSIVKIARELGIKIVATNDSHFISCYDVEAHDALLCILTQKRITDDKRLRYSGTEYLKSAVEMKLLFRDHLPDDVIEEAINNTLEVADKVQAYNILGEPRIPDYPVPLGHTADSYLEEVTWQGLLERLKCRHHSEIDPVYKQRLQTELKVMQEKGFSTYFLVVWDYIKYARDNDIPVGPGRGSAAGSLVAYCLKITNIDPIHHGLLFERFLNPERKSMPDVDTDFCPDRREEMIRYVTDKYGEDNVAQIITFNRMTSKAVLKDVGRVLGVDFADQNRIAKMIPVVRGKPTKLKVMVSEKTPEPAFRDAYENATVKVYNDRKEEVGTVTVRQWVDMAMRIEGTNKTFGVHAAGVVISSQPLDEIVPLQKNNDGSVITQYYMEDLEALGLLKMDFLGLKNLTTIQRAANLVARTRNVHLDLDQIPLDERKALEILAKGKQKKLPEDIQETHKLFRAGNLEGIFQLESDGMKQITRDLKPSGIEDISSISALYRPGPLDAGLIPKFIKRKHGQEQVTYQHPLLKPILNETYGVIVYQEQIMKIAQDLAGYSLGEADLLRRCMGKKKLAEMEKHREKFIDGSAKNGVSKQLANSLFDEMVVFAEYCLSYDTEVLTLKYGALPIGEIVEKRINCHVYTRAESGFFYIQSIEQWHDRGEQEVFEYTLENGATIKATKDHKFMTSGGQMLPIDEIFERGLDLLEGSSYIVDGYNFKQIMPDRYSCPAPYGNHCNINIIKFDSSYTIQNDGCTETCRIHPDRLEPLMDYEEHFNNWMLSNDLYYFYDEDYSCFSFFVSNCINGYRNITYVKQQHEIDSSFTKEKGKTPKHTYIALTNAFEPSIQLYKSLKESGDFSENQLLYFSDYMKFRRITNRFRNACGEERINPLQETKKVFDYIIANLNNINNIVTNEMIEQFQELYKTNLEAVC